MLRQTRHISFIETAGELGALLLEAQLIKQQQPLFNKRLRRSKQLCALRLQADTVTIAHAKEIDFAVTPHLYGLFANRHAALESCAPSPTSIVYVTASWGSTSCPPGAPASATACASAPVPAAAWSRRRNMRGGSARRWNSYASPVGRSPGEWRWKSRARRCASTM